MKNKEPEIIASLVLIGVVIATMSIITGSIYIFNTLGLFISAIIFGTFSILFYHKSKNDTVDKVDFKKKLRDRMHKPSKSNHKDMIIITGIFSVLSLFIYYTINSQSINVESITDIIMILLYSGLPLYITLLVGYIIVMSIRPNGVMRRDIVIYEVENGNIKREICTLYDIDDIEKEGDNIKIRDTHNTYTIENPKNPMELKESIQRALITERI
jgi:uncharacterized membrane protein YiaA